MSDLQTVSWELNKIRLIDQTCLPRELRFVYLEEWTEAVEAIKTMVVRGAPAIGCTAALALAMGANTIIASSPETFHVRLKEIGRTLCSARPTAVNLMWAIDRLIRVATTHTGTIADIKETLLNEALLMLQEDVTINKALGANGAELLPQKGSVLTHCNAGALATVGYGTALGVIFSAVDQGKQIEVYADETRPRLQGMRLTSWELVQQNIPVTVIGDSMAAELMKQGKVDCVVVGADRIAANGDVANKIGTYSLAIVARYHNVPFYVAAPTSTIDMKMEEGSDIPIEQRSAEEVTHIEGIQIAPHGVNVWNPAFDVTPSDLVTAIITERGVIKAPYMDELKHIFRISPTSG